MSEYNLVTNISNCYIEIPLLLYYAHIPTALVSLFLGFFVYFKSKKNTGKLLLLISLSFAVWLSLNLITWISVDSGWIMFSWSIMGFITSLIFFLSLYFFYVYATKHDLPWLFKIILTIFLFPIIALSPFYLRNFNNTVCEAVDNIYYVYYYNLFIFLVFIAILCLYFFLKRKIEDKVFKKQVTYLLFGVEFFLFSYFITGFLASYLSEKGIEASFEIEQYGLFGMTFFMGVLAYMIVKFKAFNIKLIGAQALVVTLIILVGSQFFFADNTTSIVLTGITMALSLGFGYVLIKSIGAEVERKEQLQLMADSLAIANDKLRILDKAKTEFISIASHQLRTPVTAIKGFSSLLLEGSYGEVSAGVKGALEKVFVSSERLVNLIEDLLNVSRIESGRLTFTFEMGSLNDILQELYDSFILVAKAKKFYLDLKVPENPLPKIKMDAAKVRELISNFIDNAFKYTEKGGVTVKAEIRESGVVIDEDGFVKEGEKAPYGKVIRVTVSDTGIGVPREEIPSLFKKFSRGKDVSRLHVGGTGLGLFVGKAIADAHHGATWVESDGEGKGSRFIIEIPIEAQV